jgi:hypothetical protein
LGLELSRKHDSGRGGEHSMNEKVAVGCLEQPMLLQVIGVERTVWAMEERPSCTTRGSRGVERHEVVHGMSLDHIEIGRVRVQPLR